MKSRITIEVDFDNNRRPVIQIIQSDSDDVRDNLIKDFLQSSEHTSRWLTIQYKGDSEKGKVFQLFYITPAELEEEAKLMKSIGEVYKNDKKKKLPLRQ